MLERVTVAPATIANPRVSVTVPRISPVFLLWGNAGVEMTSNREYGERPANETLHGVPPR